MDEVSYMLEKIVDVQQQLLTTWHKLSPNCWWLKSQRGFSLEVLLKPIIIS
jgi:hypothetical protein